jgi:hypothetical protein
MIRRKEAAIARPLVRRFGLQVFVPEGLDTDRLGTFLDELKRRGNVLERGTGHKRSR